MKYFLVLYLMSATPAGIAVVMPKEYTNESSCVRAGQAWKMAGEEPWSTKKYFVCVPHE